MTTYREDGTPVYRDDGTPVYRDDGARIYRDDRPRVVEVRRSRAGMFIGGLLLLLVIIVVVLFATGFWSADVLNPGSLPKISIQATPGTMPQVDLQSKKIVVGSKETTVAVPTVGTKK